MSHKNLLKNTFFKASLSASLILLTACSSIPQSLVGSSLSEKWMNPEPDEGVLFDNHTKDLDFYITFKAINNDDLPAASCYEMEFINPHKLKDVAYSDWQKYSASCEAVKAFFKAPEKSKSYFPETLEQINIAKLTAAANPYIGEESLELIQKKSPLINKDKTVKILEENKTLVSDEIIQSQYVLLARGDFNFDGYEDLFLRIDWTLIDDNFEDSDWIVISKRSPGEKPYLLWRQ